MSSALSEALSNDALRATSARVLVVEDEPEIRDLVVQVLSLAGYEVSAAEDGRAGLNHLAGATPNLITLDLNMPNLDGNGFLQELARSSSLGRIPVVVLSACKTELIPTRQVVQVLEKPFHLEDLLSAVNHAMR